MQSLDGATWSRAMTRLRRVRLLAPQNRFRDDDLDAHPLVREWFGSRLLRSNPPAWRAAHGRLYEYLRDTTHEGRSSSLQQLEPLYEAIGHGCCAGRHQEAFDDVYARRVSRTYAPGQPKYYSQNNLGAYDSDLAAFTWFFDKPYSRPRVSRTAPKVVKRLK